MEQAKLELLVQSLDQLGLSRECVCNLNEMKLGCLQDFINKGWQSLRQSDSFNYRYFNEVISLLRERDLLYLMENC